MKRRKWRRAELRRIQSELDSLLSEIRTSHVALFGEPGSERAYTIYPPSDVEVMIASMLIVSTS